MQLRAWQLSCEEALRSNYFETAVAAHLQAIWDALLPHERAAKAGAFGGFLRSKRSHARLVLIEALMRELGIESTQHVACRLMCMTFAEAACTATLNQFAKPGRDASDKQMAAALSTYSSSKDEASRYASMYSWYCTRLKQRVAEIRDSLLSGARSAGAMVTPEPARTAPLTRPVSQPAAREPYPEAPNRPWREFKHISVNGHWTWGPG